MALALKRTGRAVLIGEATYDAGYFTRQMDLGAGFVVNRPIGRTFDPDTGQGFEGTGRCSGRQSACC
jgi:C-terminal processing protease CtpA/Prc